MAATQSPSPAPWRDPTTASGSRPITRLTIETPAANAGGHSSHGPVSSLALHPLTVAIRCEGTLGMRSRSSAAKVEWLAHYAPEREALAGPVAASFARNGNAESEAVCVAAINEMFDRGFGRATQTIEGTMTYGVSDQVAELFKENAGGILSAWTRPRGRPDSCGRSGSATSGIPDLSRS